MPPNVPSSESGTATLGMTVARTLRRKTNTTSTTSTTDNISVSCTSRKDARMVVVRSSTTLSAMVGGIEARSAGRSASTRSTVSMMLAPGCRNMTRRTARRPLASPPVRRSSTELSMSAMSPRRTGAPFA
jgi:hypothetical protein